MTSRHKNSSHGRFSKKQKKASRTMMMMKRGTKFDRPSSGSSGSSFDMDANAGLLAATMMLLKGAFRKRSA